jgi:DNA repair exonuclease SbcCD ATPase subunit
VIEKLAIKGFQAHDELELSLDPGVTTIIGSSDVGKSSVIRALRWLALNLPSGDSFVRWGAKRARVEAEVGGDVVLRERGTENLYALGTREFRAFGNGGVPEEIAKLLGVTEINFQGQYDSPFWLSDTAGEVSRHLNRIVGLEIIDDILSKLTSLIRKRTIEVEVTEGRLTAARQECRDWKFVESVDVELSALETLSCLFDEWQKKAISLGSIVCAYGSGEIALSEVSTFVAEGTRVVGDGERLALATSACGQLRTLIHDAEVQHSFVYRGRDIPDEMLLAIVEECDKAVAELTVLIRACDQGVCEESQARSELEQLAKKWVLELGEECPLCGQKIKH